MSVPKQVWSSVKKAIDNLRQDFIFNSGSEDRENNQHLADITDGMSLIDIRNLAALSRQSEIPLSVEDLVNLYRFGEKESPWTQLNEEESQTQDRLSDSESKVKMKPLIEL